MIYLLFECEGAYEDYREYTLAYFTDKKEAEEKVREFNTKLDELKDMNKKLYEYDYYIEDCHGFFLGEVELFTDKHYPDILSDDGWEEIIEKDRKWREANPTLVSSDVEE